MEELYHQTNRIIQDIHNNLMRLETSSPDGMNHIENTVQIMIDKVVSNCERLEILVNKEVVSRRAQAKFQLNRLQYDCQHLQAALRQMQHKRYQKEEEMRERDALLSQDFKTNESTSIFIDPSLDHHDRLHTTSRRVDDLILSGSDILSNLKDQRVTLKGAHRKLLDFVNVLGLSNTVVRLIEKRSSQDKIIFCVGAIVTLIIMFLVWRYYG